MLLVYGFLCLTLPLKTILPIEIAECTILHWTVTFSKLQVTLSHAKCATEWNEDSRKLLCFRWVFSADLYQSLDYTVSSLSCKAHSESFISPFKELRKGVKSAQAHFCFPLTMLKPSPQFWRISAYSKKTDQAFYEFYDCKLGFFLCCTG